MTELLGPTVEEIQLTTTKDEKHEFFPVLKHSMELHHSEEPYELESEDIEHFGETLHFLSTPPRMKST